ncbi:hypothetical protein ACQEVF_56985 [Nonomuraea polychroma]|uniref:hypothetical protein n=1 Tax=Nonomuraea polychroma TaxID=46176 RepID=UPI003D8DEC54
MRLHVNPWRVRETVARGHPRSPESSVALAEEIGTSLRADGVGAEVEHRDVDKPVLPPQHA